MKIELDDKLVAVVFLLFSLGFYIYFNLNLVTPNSDNYLHYLYTQEIIKDPVGVLAKQGNYTSPRLNYLLNSEKEMSIFAYPPLGYIFFGLLMKLSLDPEILILFSITVVIIILYKKEYRAIPLLFLSFAFTHYVLLGDLDIFMVMLTLLCWYYFDKNILLSGVFAGLSTLTKTTGFITVLAFLIGIIIFKRKEINVNKEFFKSKIFLGLIIMMLIISVWYGRNLVFFKFNIIEAVTGSNVTHTQQHMLASTQTNQPERGYIDKTGIFPLPIDLLFYCGIVATAINLVKNRKPDLKQIFILCFFIFFLLSGSSYFKFISAWRYYIPVFPLLAIEVVNLLKNKVFIAYLVCAVMLLLSINFSKHYNFNSLSEQVSEYCAQLSNYITAYQPVNVKYYHNWFLAYKCGLNLSSEQDAEFLIDENLNLRGR